MRLFVTGKIKMHLSCGTSVPCHVTTYLNNSTTLQHFSNFNVSFDEKSTASIEVIRQETPGAEVKTQVNLKFIFISLGLCIIRK